jgi:hypothetical protein
LAGGGKARLQRQLQRLALHAELPARRLAVQVVGQLRVREQIARMAGLAVLAPVRRRGGGHEVDRHQAPHDLVGVVDRTDAKRQVDSLLDQIEHAVGHVQVQGHLGVLQHELAQQGRQVGLHQRVRGRRCSRPLGRVARWCSSPWVRSISSSSAPLRSNSSCPASVSDTLRVVRLNRRRPKRASSCAIDLLTLAGDTPCARRGREAAAPGDFAEGLDEVEGVHGHIISDMEQVKSF